jgi:CRP/FNR family transcriptional regulator
MHRPAVVRVAYYRGNDPCSSCQLRAQSVCNAMQDYDLARLAAFAVEREFKIGETFIEEGEPALDSFTVTRGTVKLFKLLPDGCQQVTGFARVGHFLGLAAPDGYAFGAQALEAVSLCRFSRSKLRMLLQDSPALENRLLQIASTELVAAQEQMMLLRRKTARERLATFLVMRCRQSVCSGLLGESVSLPMSRGEIADYLGITIERSAARSVALRRTGGSRYHRIGRSSFSAGHGWRTWRQGGWKPEDALPCRTHSRGSALDETRSSRRRWRRRRRRRRRRRNVTWTTATCAA